MLFSHVIDTSNLEDFQLMSEVTRTLGEFAEESPAISGIRKLFEAFVSLCKPVVRGGSFSEEGRAQRTPTFSQVGNGLSQNIEDRTARSIEDMEGVGTQDWANPPAGLSDDIISYLDTFQAVNVEGISHINTMGEQELMAELYHTQPSIRWIDEASTL